MRELARLDRFLIAHADRIANRGDALGLLHDLAADHAAPVSLLDHAWQPELPELASARETLGLGELAAKLLVIALAPELDARYARVFAYLNGSFAKPRPTAGLALAVLGGGLHDLDQLLPASPLRRYALVELTGDEPLASQCLVVAPDVWPRLAGITAARPFPVRAAEPGALAALALADRVRDEANRAAQWLRRRTADHGILIVRGRPGTGRGALARAIVAEAGFALLEPSSAAEPARVLREARWARAVVAVDEDATLELEAPLVTCREHGRAHALRPTFELRVPDPDAADRARVWAAVLARDPAVEIAAVAQRFRFGPARMVDALKLARERHDGELTTEALVEACRESPQPSFGMLAERLPCPFEPEDIVLRPASKRDLDLAAQWSRFIVERLTPVQTRRLSLRGGPVCLFHGPPGTGKTMAAQIVARQLGLDLYRVDLSQVINKYVGETEKHLAMVFREAEAANVVLFFDEADALFARRTDVRDSQDRYANVETGFLLQRLENHAGPAILATNLLKNLDDAFLRRFHIVVELVMPAAAERAQIWHRLLPAEHRHLDIDFLARFPLSGGDIRNAVITATVLATNEELAMEHVVLGVHRELQKAGRLVEIADFGPWAATVRRTIPTRAERRSGH